MMSYRMALAMINSNVTILIARSHSPADGEGHSREEQQTERAPLQSSVGRRRRVFSHSRVTRYSQLTRVATAFTATAIAFAGVAVRLTQQLAFLLKIGWQLLAA